MLYLSENLFNTDPKLEFMYIYNSDPYTYVTQLYNEDGTLIFDAWEMAPLIFVNTPLQQYPIYNSFYGTKMILSHKSSGQAFVYDLPGVLSTGIEEANSSLVTQCNFLNPYPNPSADFITINYSLPQGFLKGEIVLYDTSGIERRRFQVTDTVNTIRLASSDLEEGTYYCQLQSVNAASEGKKIVVIK